MPRSRITHANRIHGTTCDHLPAGIASERPEKGDSRDRIFCDSDVVPLHGFAPSPHLDLLARRKRCDAHVSSVPPRPAAGDYGGHSERQQALISGVPWWLHTGLSCAA